MLRCRPSWTGMSLGLLSMVAALTIVSGEQHFEYDQDLAKLSVVYSSAAYDQNPSVSGWSFVNKECNDKTKGFILDETFVGDETEAFGYVGVDAAEKRIIVAFKGTSDTRDWVTNLRTWVRYQEQCEPTRTPKVPAGGGARVGTGPGVGGQFAEGGAAAAAASAMSEAASSPEEERKFLIGNVHYGFCEYYQTLVAEGLAVRIQKLADYHPTYTIFITGHSLGAAAAAVCATDLTQRLGIAGERVVLYTLGEPRTGDGVFAAGLEDYVGTAYRIVHHKDVVPHLALCCHGWLGRCEANKGSCPYQHSTEIVYDNAMGPHDKWLACDDTVGEDYACDPQAWDLSVADHLNYFQIAVGQYCNTAPEDLTPFDEAQAEEEERWAEYDDYMFDEDERLRSWAGLSEA